MLGNLSGSLDYFIRKKSEKYKNQSLIITPLLYDSKKANLPLIKSKVISPRKIPLEFQFSKVKAYQLSKTPSPFYGKLQKYSLLRENYANVFEKVQHQPLVKNLTEGYCRKERNIQHDGSGRKMLYPPKIDEKVYYMIGKKKINKRMLSDDISISFFNQFREP